MYTMEDFKAGKIAVWAETKAEAMRFLQACEKNGVKWASGNNATSDNTWILGDFEYAYGTLFKGISAPRHDKYAGYKMRGYTAANYATERKPYKSVTVANFFANPKTLGYQSGDRVAEDAPAEREQR